MQNLFILNLDQASLFILQVIMPKLQDNLQPDQPGIKIVLDSAICVGKSVLLNFLKTGCFRIMRPTIGSNFAVHNITFMGEMYRGIIEDTCGGLPFGEKLRFVPFADVLLFFFAIDAAVTLKELICESIPSLRKHFPKKPILLVAVRGDQRNANNYKHDLFPLPCGPALAQLVGQ